MFFFHSVNGGGDDTVKELMAAGISLASIVVGKFLVAYFLIQKLANELGG